MYIGCPGEGLGLGKPNIFKSRSLGHNSSSMKLVHSFLSISIFGAAASRTQAEFKYTHTLVRKNSFYSFDTTSTGSLSTCANVCTLAIKKGKRVQGCVFRKEEKTCAPTEFAPFEMNTRELGEEDLTDAVILNGNMTVRAKHGTDI